MLELILMYIKSNSYMDLKFCNLWLFFLNTVLLITFCACGVVNKNEKVVAYLDNCFYLNLFIKLLNLTYCSNASIICTFHNFS